MKIILHNFVATNTTYRFEGIFPSGRNTFSGIYVAFRTGEYMSDKSLLKKMYRILHCLKKKFIFAVKKSCNKIVIVNKFIINLHVQLGKLSFIFWSVAPLNQYISELALIPTGQCFGQSTTNQNSHRFPLH